MSNNNRNQFKFPVFCDTCRLWFEKDSSPNPPYCSIECFNEFVEKTIKTNCTCYRCKKNYHPTKERLDVHYCSQQCFQQDLDTPQFKSKLNNEFNFKVPTCAMTGCNKSCYYNEKTQSYLLFCGNTCKNQAPKCACGNTCRYDHINEKFFGRCSKSCTIYQPIQRQSFQNQRHQNQYWNQTYHTGPLCSVCNIEVCQIDPKKGLYSPFCSNTCKNQH